MNVSETAKIMGFRRDVVIQAIESGIQLPKSKANCQLSAEKIGDNYEISDESLNEFISKFEEEEPGRYPPVDVRRHLLVESKHRCGICERLAPLQFHHIVLFSEVPHHDPANMMAVCGTCHDLINNGSIDLQEQRQYKDRLVQYRIAKEFDVSVDEFFPSLTTGLIVSWEDLAGVINSLHEHLNSEDDANSKFDLKTIDIDEKNRINNMGRDYFLMMDTHHQPFFGTIEKFLRNPANQVVAEKYYEIVDYLRSVIAMQNNNYDSFDQVLFSIRLQAINDRADLNTRTLNILVSFMYYYCDIGEKE